MTKEQKQAARIVLDYLEENNCHTIGRLVAWELFGEGNNTLMEEAYEAAKKAMYKQFN